MAKFYAGIILGTMMAGFWFCTFYVARQFAIAAILITMAIIFRIIFDISENWSN